MLIFIDCLNLYVKILLTLLNRTHILAQLLWLLVVQPLTVEPSFKTNAVNTPESVSDGEASGALSGTTSGSAGHRQ